MLFLVSSDACQVLYPMQESPGVPPQSSIGVGMQINMDPPLHSPFEPSEPPAFVGTKHDEANEEVEEMMFWDIPQTIDACGSKASRSENRDEVRSTCQALTGPPSLGLGFGVFPLQDALLSSPENTHLDIYGTVELCNPVRPGSSVSSNSTILAQDSRSFNEDEKERRDPQVDGEAMRTPCPARRRETSCTTGNEDIESDHVSLCPVYIPDPCRFWMLRAELV
jgi:hypothetical protein